MEEKMSPENVQKACLKAQLSPYTLLCLNMKELWVDPGQQDTTFNKVISCHSFYYFITINECIGLLILRRCLYRNMSAIAQITFEKPDISASCVLIWVCSTTA